MERCFMSYAVSKLQTVIMGYHYKPIRVVKLQKQKHLQNLARKWSNRKFHCWKEGKASKFSWNTVCWFLTKLNITWVCSYTPWHHLNELKIWFHITLFTWRFVEALFITAQTWKQPGCPSGSAGNIVLIGALKKRDELFSHETLRNPECILLRERSQSVKITSCTLNPIFDRF